MDGYHKKKLNNDANKAKQSIIKQLRHQLQFGKLNESQRSDITSRLKAHLEV